MELILIVVIVGLAPMFYNINRRLRKLEEENLELRKEIDLLKEK